MIILTTAIFFVSIHLSKSLVILRPVHSCMAPNSHLCSRTGLCIRVEWLCDGDDDCGDASDEDPLICKPKGCKPDEWTCTTTRRCIQKHWVCDGEEDCDDHSDERNCSSIETTCPPDRFSCGSGRCIPFSWVCDGAPDCATGVDEESCESKTCSPDEFMCSNRRCLDKVLICDGDDDCGDNTDENNCRSCPKGHFECKDHSCILEKWKCDGDLDCTDHSDEHNCTDGLTTKMSSTCGSDEFQCSDRITCIDSAWVCNGRKECPDGADESLPVCKSNISCRLDQFKCKNNECIAGKLQCNDHKDCLDGSDEDNCGTMPPPCSTDQFDCGNRECIPLHKACDGHPDCPSGEDEPSGKCGINECLKDNGGCSQECVDSPTGYSCTCKTGFKLIDDTNCDDINECDDPSSCSQICTNLKGSFKCDCMEGYMKDSNNHRSCKASKYNATLIVTKRHDIREISLHSQEMRVLINETKSAIALDFDINSGLIFWGDGLGRSINRANITKRGKSIQIVEEDSTPCDGLAVDWIYKHIYWTDTDKDTISVAKYDGSSIKTLIKDHLDKPRAIAVDPVSGWLYWSDWGKHPKIERAGMDASHRSAIVYRGVEWPNGITLDLEKHRLYWVDAKLDTIGSVNFDGTHRKTVIKSSSAVAHPFSIAVFEDYIYWTDWVNQAVFRANKFDGSKVSRVVEDLSNLMVVHVNHPYKQPKGVNYCTQMKCPHLCLPAPRINNNSAKASCTCPDNIDCSNTQGHTTIQEEHTTAMTHVPLTRPWHTTPHITISTTTRSQLSHNNSSSLVNSRPTGTRSNSKNFAIIGTLLVVGALIGVSSYFGFHRYKRTSGGNAFVNPMYHRAGDEEVTLTKDDYSQRQHEAQQEPPQSRSTNNYENFL